MSAQEDNTVIITEEMLPFNQEFPDFEGLFNIAAVAGGYMTTLATLAQEQATAILPDLEEVNKLYQEFIDPDGDLGCAEDSIMNKYPQFRQFHP